LLSQDKTGLAFILTMSYNKFRELFHRSEADKALIEKEKILKEKAKLKEQQAKDKTEANKQKMINL
jgi:hypothetical protein